jgi:hypothetical protein
MGSVGGILGALPLQYLRGFDTSSVNTLLKNNVFKLPTFNVYWYALQFDRAACFVNMAQFT